ncbi:MAG: SDR family oxidoreductase [Actinobacteria bacterium]|nr:SDR family oxidoreductase [Actinomycetota bacterium]
MRILVTGGAGFLGSHLCAAILARGDEVVAIDNFATSDYSAIKRLSHNDRFHFVEADVCTAPPVTGRFDAIAHLACPASPDEYLRLPLETLAIGSHGSEFVLRLAELNRCRVLLASTSEIYGDPLVRPQREDYWGNVNPIGPRSVYDESKRYAEALFTAHRRALGTNTAIVRIFNTYGPGLRPNDGRVVSNFIAQALNGEPLTVYGDGQQTRSFCYVTDLVGGLLRMLHSIEPGPVNLGNPNEITVLELAETIRLLTGSDVPLDFRPAPQDDPTTRRPDISKAAALLGWTPEVPLAEGLERTIAWQRSLSAVPA